MITHLKPNTLIFINMEFNINIIHFNSQELTKEEQDEVMNDIACMLQEKKYILAGGITPVPNANLN